MRNPLAVRSEPPVIAEIDVPELIAALRSGNFTQGLGALYHMETDSYCCLGVACQLLTDKDQVVKVVFPNRETVMFRAVNDEDPHSGSFSFLPRDVKFPESVGIIDTLGTFKQFPDDRGGCLTSLVGLNDDGFTFNQIADLLQYLYDNPIREN